MKSLSLVSGKNLTLLVNGQELNFDDKKSMNKEIKRLEKQGFEWPSKFTNTDEFDGLVQANQLGFKTFDCTIMS